MSSNDIVRSVVCDAKCQKQRRLDSLKNAMDRNPGNEQMRLAYYTELNGQGWLAKEKEKIASSEIEPVVSEYTTKYNTLKEKKKNQNGIVDMVSIVDYQQQQNEEELKFLNKQVEKTKTQTDVNNRLVEVNNQPTESTNMPLILDIITAIIGLIAAYLLYTKFDKIKSYFGYSSSSMPESQKEFLNI